MEVPQEVGQVGPPTMQPRHVGPPQLTLRPGSRIRVRPSVRPDDANPIASNVKEDVSMLALKHSSFRVESWCKSAAARGGD